MANTFQTTKSHNAIPKLAVGILLALFGTGLFVVGFDQGHILSAVQGQQAFHDLYLHEFTHDMRHAAGFPCH